MLAFLPGTDPHASHLWARAFAAISLVIFATETTVFSARDDTRAFDALARNFILTNVAGAIVFVLAVLFVVGTFSPS